MPAVGRGSSKPKSLVEHLSDHAPKRLVNDILPIDRYLTSAKYLIKQAADYRRIGDEEQLYVMLLRFASLMVETIPKHRDFRDSHAEYKVLKRDLLGSYLPELEQLKISLRLKERPEPPAAASRNRPAYAVQLSVSALPQVDWASSGAPVAAAPPPPPPPDAAGALLRVDDLLEVMGQAPPPPPPPAAPAAPSAPPAAVAAAPTDPYALAAAAAASLAATPSALDIPQSKYALTYSASSGRHALFGGPSQPAGSSSSGAAGAVTRLGSADGRGLLPRYPTVLDAWPAAAAAAGELTQLSLSPGQQQQQLLALVAGPHPAAGPSLGPQEIPVDYLPASTQGLPDTCRLPHAAPPPPPAPSPSAPSSSSVGPTPGGPKELRKLAQLRDVHVSVSLMNEFLAFARSNTARGVESCGILAGRLLAGDSTFAITTLIIPKQQGTSDTVHALNEEEIFEAQFERELYPLGWIHTHPTQTCFLSSVDVHTQCGYQTMLDEAVAIVMAPTDPSKKCGIFRLSTPGGLGLVQRCPQRGFHTHPPTDSGQELYELSKHVFLNERTKHEVLDLR
ncbi:hypothetical protein PLESTB_001201200 [Pleodorina starrii]|uniref:MPN domain-containing protein n=1 Tax=Pleodorina starrii TaxID=330485 RepID=A0A9W6F5P5_9CHLO|nr:hypothetical protein PLESTM_001805600 [Pleodorina starrii]GLC57224.1 hypothetical protein PLESTB_001201200 [Pleodorina starrii]